MRQRRSPGCESVGGAHARVLRPQYWRARRGDARRCSAHALPRRLQGRGVTAAGRQSPGAARAAEGPSGSSAPSTARRSPRGRGVKGLTAREGLPRPLSGVQGTCLSCPAETGPRVSRGRMVRPLIKSPSEVSSLGAQNVSSDLPHHSPQMQSVPPCSQKRSPTCSKRLPFLTEGAGCPTITIHLGIYCS